MAQIARRAGLAVKKCGPFAPAGVLVGHAAHRRRPIGGDVDKADILQKRLDVGE